MKILEINSVLYGSTGKIALQIAELARASGHEAIVCVPRGRHNKKKRDNNIFYFGNQISEDSHLMLSRLTGLNGYFSLAATMQLISKINEFDPDVIHMHNLHNSYINLPLFFSYLKKSNRKIVWTFHDCWPFTGHCPHFTLVNCEKWKIGCRECEQFRQYPQSFVDTSNLLWKKKKKWFCNVDNLTIVTPSKWLAGLVNESFINEYPVRVINNGINLNIFSPKIGDFRERNNISHDMVIVLGVAFGWGVRKGLDVFIELFKHLDDKKYKIVLVGTSDSIDSCLPEGIISVHRTKNQTELAEIYSAADVFVNPTREDNYPTVNMEAMACGTPVITFATGGSVETITNETGRVVNCEDIEGLVNSIIEVSNEGKKMSEKCLEQAIYFDCNERFLEYINLFKHLTE